MKKTKAAFRALREDCGLSQQDVADEADVAVRSVKRWESPNDAGYNPPDDVWRFLLECRGALYEDARLIAEEIIGSAGKRGDEVKLRYWRSQEALDAEQLPDVDEPVGYANARMREVGRLLDKAGVAHTFEYEV